MNYRQQLPGPPLSLYVDRFWYYDGLELPHSKERVLPDGGFELIFNLDDVPRKLFDREDFSRFELFRRGWISGAHYEYLVIDVLQGGSMMGVHFKPAGSAPFLPLPADELSGCVMDLEAIWGSGIWSWRDRFLEAPGPWAKFRLLENFLIQELTRRVRAEERRRTVEWAVERFTREPHLQSIADISRQIGFTQKHFIDQFRREVGLTPKRFCRVRRFQKVLEQIGSKGSIDWAEVAFSCGYYDQAHFINDFRAFSGLKPSVYLSKRLEYPSFASAD